MANERKEKLQKLQIEKEWWVNQALTTKSSLLQKIYNQWIKRIKNQMADLNKLDDSEKNIHAIWIGIPPKGEFDNLKLWTKYNPDYKIHIWTDSNHILTNKLNTIIKGNSKIWTTDDLSGYQLEALYKDKFYDEYHITNPDKTFDENAKEFLLADRPHTDLIDEWIKEAKERYLQEVKEIKKYTSSEVIIHDVNQEKDSIFPSKKYYEGYLETLEHLHLCAGASDRLRYAVLDKFGGLYIDTDTGVKFDLTAIKKNQEITQLIDQVECHEDFDKVKNEVILNHIILLNNINKLNYENLYDFSNNWEELFGGSAEKNLLLLKEIGQKFKNLDLKVTPQMKIDNFPLDNAFAVDFHIKDEKDLGNAFIVSKKDSNFLQTIMKGIELTDEKLKKIEIDTYTKLINKNAMVLYHTGPISILNTLKIKDKNHHYLNAKHSYKMITFQNLNAYESTWYNFNRPKTAIKDPNLCNSFFYSYPYEIINFNQLKETFQNVLDEEKEETNDFELVGY